MATKLLQPSSPEGRSSNVLDCLSDIQDDLHSLAWQPGLAKAREGFCRRWPAYGVVHHGCFAQQRLIHIFGAVSVCSAALLGCIPTIGARLPTTAEGHILMYYLQ